MGGFFGAVSANDCIQDVFFGTDYHSHLGTRRGGMAAYDPASDETVSDVVRRADKRMYEEKRRNRGETE